MPGRSYKEGIAKKGVTEFVLPPEMMTETLERRNFSAEFDDTLLTFRLSPGRDGKNAVILGYCQTSLLCYSRHK